MNQSKPIKRRSDRNDRMQLFDEVVARENSECIPQERDPLENLGDNVEEGKVYRMDCVVFAEPLKNNFSKANDGDKASRILEEEVDTIHIDNVTVTKRKGRRKKYIIHMEESSLVCPQQHCKKVFSSKTLLKAHIRKVHCSEKDFVCEQCGATFTAQYLLKRHCLVHSREKVQCPVCNKMLSRRTNLRLHLRSHSDTRPHECPVCSRRFLRKPTLDVHLHFVHKSYGKGEERSVQIAVENSKQDDTKDANAV